MGLMEDSLNVQGKISRAEFEANCRKHAAEFGPSMLLDHKAHAEIVADHIIAGFHRARALRTRVHGHLQLKGPQTPPQISQATTLFADFSSPLRNGLEGRDDTHQLSPLGMTPLRTHRSQTTTPRTPPNTVRTPNSANIRMARSGRCASAPDFEDSPRPNGTPASKKPECRVDQQQTFFGSLLQGLKETAQVKKTDPKGRIRDMEKRNAHLEVYCKQLEIYNNQILLLLSGKSNEQVEVRGKESGRVAELVRDMELRNALSPLPAPPPAHPLSAGTRETHVSVDAKTTTTPFAAGGTLFV